MSADLRAPSWSTVKWQAKRIEELEAELAALRKSAGGYNEKAALEAIRMAVTGRTRAPTFVARATVALLNARGFMSSNALSDAIVLKEDRSDLSKAACNAIHFIRRCFGVDAVETVWGLGYRLTPQGRERIAAVIDAANAHAEQPSTEGLNP